MQTVQTTEYKNQAAVLVIINEIDGAARLLFIQRSKHLNSHAGEIAFPGGKWESSDDSLVDTAYRETFEEVGIEKSALSYKGELPAHFTRRQVKVSPYVVSLNSPVELRLCEFELESAFWAPVDYFCQDTRVQTDIFNFNEKEYWAPVYQYQGAKIWGFTARLLVTFLNQYYGTTISRSHSAPEKVFKV